MTEDHFYVEIRRENLRDSANESAIEIPIQNIIEALDRINVILINKDDQQRLFDAYTLLEQIIVK